MKQCLPIVFRPGIGASLLLILGFRVQARQGSQSAAHPAARRLLTISRCSSRKVS